MAAGELIGTERHPSGRMLDRNDGPRVSFQIPFPADAVSGASEAAFFGPQRRPTASALLATTA